MDNKNITAGRYKITKAEIKKIQKAKQKLIIEQQIIKKND